MKNLEIERKFLVKNDSWRESDAGLLYIQGYLKTLPYTIRVRIEGTSSFLTIKEPLKDIIRHEFEYPIPIDEADYILKNLCEKKPIRKYRYTRVYDGLKWVIDEFLDDNKGLVIAELELGTPTQAFTIPPWVGQEVSSNTCYYNSNLIDYPFNQW